MKYPETKAKATFFEEENVQWGISKPIGQALVHYFYDLGARHDLPDDKDELVRYIKRFHKRMTVDNIHCPDDVPFDVLYSSFCSAVLNGTAELPEYQPHATKNQLQAFKAWITQGNQLERLYERMYQEYPEEKPKQIANKTTKLEDWPDEWIRSQHETICRIYKEDDKAPVFNTSNAESYFNRIKAEYEKRFEDNTAEMLE